MRKSCLFLLRDRLTKFLMLILLPPNTGTRWWFWRSKKIRILKYHALNWIGQGRRTLLKTLKALEQIYGNTRDLGWIIGADSLIEYKIWKDFDDVLARCAMIATTRPNLRSQSGAISGEQSGYNVSSNRC